MNTRAVLLFLLGVGIIAAAGVALFSTAVPPDPAGPAPSPAAILPALPTLAYPPGEINGTAGRVARSADSESPMVKDFIAAHTRNTITGHATIADVSDVWEAIYANWSYMRDPPAFNLFLPASESIRNGLHGNCLDYAILNAAVIESLGGTARVVSAYDMQGNGHAYTELYVGDSMESVQQVGDYIAARYSARTVHWHIAESPSGKKEYWLNLDWQAQYPGGPIFADNGAYFVSFLSGTGARYADNGTLFR